MSAAPTEDVGELARVVRELREQRGWSKRELASMAGGIHPSFISEIERGRIRNPGVYTLWNVAVALGVPLERLMGVTGGTTRQRTSERRRTSRERVIGHVVTLLERARAPIVYVHERTGDEPAAAVLVDPMHWDRLLALIPESEEATALLMAHEHMEPNP